MATTLHVPIPVSPAAALPLQGNIALLGLTTFTLAIPDDIIERSPPTPWYGWIPPSPSGAPSTPISRLTPLFLDVPEELETRPRTPSRSRSSSQEPSILTIPATPPRTTTPPPASRTPLTSADAALNSPSSAPTRTPRRDDEVLEVATTPARRSPRRHRVDENIAPWVSVPITEEGETQDQRDEMQEDMPVPPAPALHRSNTPDEAPQRSDTVLDLGISALVLSDSTRPRPLRRQRAVAFELPVPEEVAAPRNLQRSDTVLELPSSQSTPVPSESIRPRPLSRQRAVAFELPALEEVAAPRELQRSDTVLDFGISSPPPPISASTSTSSEPTRPRPLRRQHAVVFAPTATEAAPRNLQCSDTLLDLPSSSSTHPPSECTTPRALRRQHAVAFEEFEAPEVPTKRPRRSNTPSLPSTPAPSESTSPRPDAPTFDVEAVDRALLRIQRTMVGRPIRPLPCRAFAVDVPMLPSITENDVPTRPTSPGHDIPTRPTSPKSEPEPFIPTRPATPIPLPPARTLKRNYATFHALKHQPQTYLQPIPHNASPEPILSALHWKPGNLHVEWNAYETTVLPNGKKGLRIVPDQLVYIVGERKKMRKVLLTRERLMRIGSMGPTCGGFDGYLDGIYVSRENVRRQDIFGPTWGKNPLCIGRDPEDKKVLGTRDWDDKRQTVIRGRRVVVVCEGGAREVIVHPNNFLFHSKAPREDVKERVERMRWDMDVCVDLEDLEDLEVVDAREGMRPWTKTRWLRSGINTAQVARGPMNARRRRGGH